MFAPTPPGYKVSGPKVCVMFVSGHQAVFGWHNAEYVIGWKGLMRIILNNFETFTVMEDIKTHTQEDVEKWAKEGWMGRGTKVLLDVNISEEEYFSGPFGEIKQVRIQFFDQLSTQLRFYVRQHKKPPVKGSKSLTDLCLKDLAMNVRDAKQIGKLELPRQLQHQLDDQIRNCWCPRYLSDVREKNRKTKRANCTTYFTDKSHSWKAKYFDEDEG